MITARIYACRFFALRACLCASISYSCCALEIRAEHLSKFMSNKSLGSINNQLYSIINPRGLRLPSKRLEVASQALLEVGEEPAATNYCLID